MQRQEPYEFPEPSPDAPHIAKLMRNGLLACRSGSTMLPEPPPEEQQIAALRSRIDASGFITELDRSAQQILGTLRPLLESCRSAAATMPAPVPLPAQVAEVLHSHADLLGHSASSGPGLVSRCMRQVRRVFKVFLRPWLHVQTHFNYQIAQLSESLHAEISKQGQRNQAVLEKQLQANDALQAMLNMVCQKLQEETQFQRDLLAIVENVYRQMQAFHKSLQVLNAELGGEVRSHQVLHETLRRLDGEMKELKKVA